MTPRPPPFRTATGLPVTYAGRVVSPDEWARLSAWDRHGPDGRVWCGLARDWRPMTEAERAQDAAERAEVPEERGRTAAEGRA